MGWRQNMQNEDHENQTPVEEGYTPPTEEGYAPPAEEEGPARESTFLRKIAGVVIALIVLAIVNYFSGANSHFYKGLYYQYKGDSRSAVESYTKFIEEEPDNADAYYNRGSIFLDSGMYNEAVKDYTMSIKLEGDDYEALYGRGVAYNLLSMHKSAIEDFIKVIDLKPDFPDAYSSLGAVYLSLRNYDQAILYYDKASEIDPGFAASSYYFKGFIYDETGKINKAIENYKLFLVEADPNKYPESIPYIQDARDRIITLSDN
jgi:tetratricopeptide (TPR) repeat protein